MNLPLGIEDYLAAATAPSTRRRYESAIAHFEVEWGGRLPASAYNVARYLSDYASTLALSTLRQRLSALAQWHSERGLPDPTKTALVRKTLKGIQVLHPEPAAYTKSSETAAPEQVERATPSPLASTMHLAVLSAAGDTHLEHSPPVVQQKEVELRFSLERQHAKVRGKEQARKVIEICCLKKHGMKPLDRGGYRYRLSVTHKDEDDLNEAIDGIIDEIHQLASTHSFFIDAQVSDLLGDRLWT